MFEDTAVPSRPARGVARSAGRLKSVFISAFLTCQSVILIHSALLLADGDSLAGPLGSLLASGAMLGFLAFVMVVGRARTSANLPGVLALSGTGFALATFGLGGPGGVRTFLYALVAFTSTLVYVFWYSRLGRTASPVLAVGRTLPDFELQDGDGKPVSAGSLLGKPTVFLFFRGNWCPLCMTQIREVAEQYRELERRGAQVVLVSPQPHEKTRELAERFDARLRFLVDAGNAAARKLGIAHDGGLPLGMEVLGYESDTVLPTLVVTGADGRILFSDQTDNYRVRPEPETFLRVLDGKEPSLPA